MAKSKANPVTKPIIHPTAKRKRHYRSADQWREIVKTYQRSDLTQSQFCKQYGIASSGLYKWQRRFEQESDSRMSNADAFVEIQSSVIPVRADDQPWDVELELGRGRILRVRVA